MAKAYIFIKVGMTKAKAVAEAVRKIPEIKSAYLCWGIPDIIAFAEVPDYKALTGLVLQRIQGIAGVTETDTRIIMEE
jgi:DNA-binding Lrp family transcriptional regulator